MTARSPARVLTISLSFRWLALVCAFASLHVCAARARAQYESYSHSQLQVFIDRVPRERTEHLFINRRQCEGRSGEGIDSAEIRMQVMNLGLLAREPRVLEFWLGPNGADCHSGVGRALSATGERQCLPVAPPIDDILSRRQNFYFLAWDLFSSAEKEPRTCDRLGEQTLYIVPLEMETPEEPSDFFESGIGAPLSVRIEVDVDAPDPASQLVAQAATDDTVVLSWLGVLPDQRHRFRVYVDTSAAQLANPGPCTSSRFAPGAEITGDLSSLLMLETSENRLSILAADLDLLPGEKMPATVVIRDAAENLSVASEVVCVERPLLDAGNAKPAPRSSGAGCAVLPAGGRARIGTSSSLFWIALWLRARQLRRGPGRLRRRRVRKSSWASV